MHRTLALLLVASCACAEDLVCWHISADPADVAKETRMKDFDTFGSPDWGVVIATQQGIAGCVPVEDGGSAYVEVPPSSSVEAYLVDIDETTYERASDSIELSPKEGEQTLSFPEGSSVRFRMKRFEPDKDSGADARPEGAKAIEPGKVHRDRVSFATGDRTDFWVLDLDGPCWVAGVVQPGGNLFQVEWWEEGSATRFDARGLDSGYFACFDGRLEGGRHLLRVRSRPGVGGRDYRLFVVTAKDGPARQEEVADFLLNRARAGRDVWPFEIDEIVDILCRLDVPAVRERIVKALSDGVPEARRVAVRAVARLRMEDARARLTEIASSDPDWQTKGAAEDALRDWDRKRR